MTTPFVLAAFGLGVKRLWVRLRCAFGWKGTTLVPANQAYRCDACGAFVDYFDRLGEHQGRSRLQPCGHSSDYSGDPDWQPAGCA